MSFLGEVRLDEKFGPFAARLMKAEDPGCPHETEKNCEIL
jgi:hypothetical protein